MDIIAFSFVILHSSFNILNARKLSRHDTLILGIIVLFIVLLRLPSLFEPAYYGDEGITMTLGQGVKRGLLLYRDLHDNKPPLLYWVAAVAQTIPRFRFLLLIWYLGTLTIVWTFARSLFKSLSIQLTVLAGFGILTSIPLFEGTVANGEIFMILPTLLACWLLFRNPTGSSRYLVVIGVLFSIGFLFKVPALFDLLGMISWLGFQTYQRSFKSWVHGYLKLLFPLMLGFGIPVGFTLLYFYAAGAGPEYMQAAYLQNVGYIGSWGNQSQQPFWQSGLLHRALLWGGSILLVFVYRRKLDSRVIFVGLWLMAALFGSLLSERPYPHYLIQALPSFTFLLGLGLENKPRREHVATYLLIGLFPLTFWLYQFWHYSTISYYRTILQYFSGSISKLDYWSRLDPGIVRNHALATYLKQHTDPEETLFVWGNEPMIYVLAHRAPASRYTTAYHVIDFRAEDEVIQSLSNQPPLYILIMPRAPAFDRLQQFVARKYIRILEYEGAIVYRVKEAI